MKQIEAVDAICKILKNDSTISTEQRISLLLVALLSYTTCSQRVGKLEDIAISCLYLTNEESNFVNGTNVTIDGGMTRKMIYEP